MRRRIVTAVVTCLTVILLAGVIDKVLDMQNTKNSIKVGFIYIGDESNAYSYNFIKAQNALSHIYDGQIEIAAKYNVPEYAVAAPVEELVQEGCDLIFSTSYGYGKTVKEIAKKYPEVQFCQATGDNANSEPVLDNYHAYMGTVYQGRYVSGVVAGMKLREMIEKGSITAEQAKIGYVGAYPYAEVISGYTAFLMGIRSVVPEATMTVSYTYTWSDYTREKEIAKLLIDDGCVIISQHSDTTGPAVVCEEMSQEREVYHIGYNQSMTEVAPRTSLISCRINWEPYENAAIAAVLKGKNIESKVSGTTYGQDAWGGFKENWVQMLDLNEAIAAEGTKEVMEKVIGDFTNGNIKVYYGNYIGVNPDNESDVVDLSTQYIENDKSSAPTFHYLLKDCVTVKEYDSTFLRKN